jgi:hypothetical protein
MNIAFENGGFVGVGSRMLDFGEFRAIVSFSDSGLGWRSVDVSHPLNDVTYGAGRYVGVGWGAILVSTNGSDWWERQSEALTVLNAVHYAGKRFVAVGDLGAVLVSDDADFRSLADPGTTNDLQDVTYGDGYYVAVGARGTILSSHDALTWKVQESGTRNDLFGVAFANATFIAVGDRGTILQSAPKAFRISFDHAAINPTAFTAHLSTEPERIFRIETSTNLVNWSTLSTISRPHGNVLLLDAGSPNQRQRFYRAVAP